MTKAVPLLNVLLLLLVILQGIFPFAPHGRQRPTFSSKAEGIVLLAAKKEPNIGKDGEVGKGENWIERTFPVDFDGSQDGGSRQLKKVEDYNLGISGKAFQTGPLSARMYDAMVNNNKQVGMSPEIIKAFKLYAMDFTAREATKAALKQNGLEMELSEEEMNEGMWGEMDNIQILDARHKPVGPLYEGVDDVVEVWAPGQPFSFVVRNVPAKIRELSLEELMTALDPKGENTDQAKQAGIPIPFEEIRSLKDLANDNVRRTEAAPRGATEEAKAYSGKDQRGYRVISRSDLLLDSVDANGAENEKTLMHVMDALVSHGVLIVDLTDKGTTFKLAVEVAKMWDASNALFGSIDNEPTIEQTLPEMVSIPSSPYAKVGYANYNNGMQFLETRLARDGSGVLPVEARDLLGTDGSSNLSKAFGTIADVGKDVVRIVTAASTIEYEGFESEGPSLSGLPFVGKAELGSDYGMGEILASRAAAKLVDELIDDGTLSAVSTSGQGTVSMSPHRLCRYKNVNDDAPKEIFGAHTDSTFVTIVPVAAVSGLEVYDEAAEKWYRPELMARLQWQLEQVAKDKDKDAFYETISSVDDGVDDITIPWHARYILVMPGEFLQIVSRNEVSAAVHRVVAGGPPRLSAPILLRGRPGMALDVPKYLGEVNNELLEEVNGMEMQQIHDAMQPSSFD